MRRRLRGALVAAALVCAAGSALAARRDWLGSAACGSCHPRQLRAWRATAHARGLPRVEEGPAVCALCHATGEAPAGPTIEAQVGCEACHGAGADYAAEDVMRNPALARELGLVELGAPAARAAVCASCHGAVALGAPPALSAPAHPALEQP
ncbi:MAG: multiheme c-type cytochrome [Kofleriaceae bacterium]